MSDNSETQWERKYYKDFCSFIDEIEAWEPDYLIPVARKSCKLLSSVSQELNSKICKKILYLEYFDYTSIDLVGKKIAIIDDVSHRATTIKDYRNKFVEKGCENSNIRTYAFIGHEDLRSPINKLDKDIIIFKNRFLHERLYQEYLSIQSSHLLLKTFQTDIDHLVIQTDIHGFTSEDFKQLLSVVDPLGYCYELNHIDGLRRFGVQFHSLLNTDFISKRLHLNIKNDFFFKIKFVYNEKKEQLTCIPIYFPKIEFESLSKEDFAQLPFPFRLPLSFSNNPNIDRKTLEKMMFWNVCLFCNTLVTRYFYSQLSLTAADLFKKFRQFNVRSNDLSRYLGEEIATPVSEGIKNYILSETSEFDEAFKAMNFNEGMFPKTYSPNNDYRKFINYLRDGYKKEAEKYYYQIEQKANPPKPEFDATVEQLIKVGDDTHPIVFSIFVDELCDLGVVVPRTKYVEEEKCWRRVYRSGENEPDKFSWRRTLAILTIGLRQLGGKKHRIYLEKVIANFTNDFPPYIDRKLTQFNDSHCIYTIPYFFGPINHTLHYELFSGYNNETTPFQFFNPKHLKNENVFSDGEFSKYKELTDLIICEKSDSNGNDENSYNSTSVVLNRSLYNKAKLQSVVDANFLFTYFEFFKLILEKSNTVVHVFALAIGRDIDLFQSYISYNFHNFYHAIERFIGTLQEKKVSRKIEQVLGLHLNSINQKIAAIDVLEEAWYLANEIVNEDEEANPFRFDKVWERVLGNRSFEETLSVARQVRNQGEDLTKYIDSLAFIEKIVKRRNGSKVKFEKIDFETIVDGLVYSDFFDSKGELVDDENLAVSLRAYTINIQEKLMSVGIKNPTNERMLHLNQVYGLDKFFLNIDIYKNKTGFLESANVASQIMKDAYGTHDFRLIFYENNGTEVFIFRNGFYEDMRLILSPNKTRIKLERIN